MIERVKTTKPKRLGPRPLVLPRPHRRLTQQYYRTRVSHTLSACWKIHEPLLDRPCAVETVRSPSFYIRGGQLEARVVVACGLRLITKTKMYLILS